MSRFKAFIKDWMLIIAILAGIAGYFVYAYLPLAPSVHRSVNTSISIIQPTLIFAMLFLTFCKIDPRLLRLKRWHLWLLLLQGGLFMMIGCWLIFMPSSGMRVILEGAMLCLICPTATAAAVVTRRLGGDINNITTYTILINLVNAMLIPLMVPLVHPQPGISLWSSAALILAKVFPLLILPLCGALLLQRFAPRLCEAIGRYQDLSFYLWAVALSLAMAVTTRSIVHSKIDISTQAWLVVVSLLCCCVQFYLGRKIGAAYDDKITAGQSFGQKNTVLAIWMGYTFFTPVTAIVGGFYSIWHNVINSWQLYHHNHHSS